MQNKTQVVLVTPVVQAAEVQHVELEAPAFGRGKSKLGLLLLLCVNGWCRCHGEVVVELSWSHWLKVAR